MLNNYNLFGKSNIILLHVILFITFAASNYLTKEKRIRERKIMDEELKKLLGLSNRIRGRIINECGITKATYSNWLRGKTPVSLLAQEKIDSIVMEETGEKMFFKSIEKLSS